MELIYQYEVQKNEPLYSLYNMEYFQYQNLIVTFSRHQFYVFTFNIDTKQFTPLEQYREVRYEELQNKTYMYQYGDCVIIVDFPNKSYAQSCRFPYSISEIDGNYITTCRDEQYFYIFHSHTIDYETGVFIFDIENNTINQKDFYLDERFEQDRDDVPAMDFYPSEYTNIFTALHQKDISACCFYQGDIFINIEDNLYFYDIKSNELSLVLNDFYFNDVKVEKDKILMKSYPCQMHLFNGEILRKDIIVYEEKYCYYYDFYQGGIITVTGDINGKIIRIYK